MFARHALIICHILDVPIPYFIFPPNAKNIKYKLLTMNASNVPNRLGSLLALSCMRDRSHATHPPTPDSTAEACIRLATWSVRISRSIA